MVYGTHRELAIALCGVNAVHEMWVVRPGSSCPCARLQFLSPKNLVGTKSHETFLPRDRGSWKRSAEQPAGVLLLWEAVVFLSSCRCSKFKLFCLMVFHCSKKKWWFGTLLCLHLLGFPTFVPDSPTQPFIVDFSLSTFSLG